MTTAIINPRSKKKMSKSTARARGTSTGAKSKASSQKEPNAESLAAIEEMEAGQLTPATLAELRSIWDNA